MSVRASGCGTWSVRFQTYGDVSIRPAGLGEADEVVLLEEREDLLDELDWKSLHCCPCNWRVRLFFVYAIRVKQALTANTPDLDPVGVDDSSKTRGLGRSVRTALSKERARGTMYSCYGSDYTAFTAIYYPAHLDLQTIITTACPAVALPECGR